MTKNPFLKRRAPPPPPRENPFLSQPQDRCAYDRCAYDRCAYDRCAYDRCAYDRCAYNLFSGSHDTIIKTPIAIMPPPPLLTFEEAFPSLSKSSQQQSQRSPLNFKLAIQTNAPRSDAPRSDAPRSDAPRSDAPRSDAPRSDAPRSDATQFMRGNMFLSPQSRCVPHHRDRDDDRAYDDRAYDAHNWQDAPAYDSEYTQYYDHRR
jgi:hypothetical protein